MVLLAMSDDEETRLLENGKSPGDMRPLRDLPAGLGIEGKLERNRESREEKKENYASCCWNEIEESLLYKKWPCVVYVVLSSFFFCFNFLLLLFFLSFVLMVLKCKWERNISRGILCVCDYFVYVSHIFSLLASFLNYDSSSSIYELFVNKKLTSFYLLSFSFAYKTCTLIT